MKNTAKQSLHKTSVKQEKVTDLNPYENNPRVHTPQQIEIIKQSILDFGFTNPILIDENKTIIAGHGRLEAVKSLGYEKVPCITLAHKDGRPWTEEEKMAYVILDNKAVEESDWSEKKLLQELIKLQLSGFDALKTGFSSDELNKLFDNEQSKDIIGAVPFSEELGESNNYVVLYFDNDIDWLSAKTHFNLKTVSSKRANGKPWSKGIGRVINGGKYLTELNEK